jgi:dethiobiotin synthetase
MSARYIVTGTDTGVGKTVFSAALAGALRATYWKPVQAGLDDETDSETVRRLANLPREEIIPETYRLKRAASPHIAAASEDLVIEAGRFALPGAKGPLVIEGAGGLLVPLSPSLLQIDLFASWRLPVILCARTMLGTINHTLLSLEAMVHRAMPVHGIAFIGDEAEEVENTIVRFGKSRSLGRLPFLDSLNASRLAEAFRANFRLSDFSGPFSE